MFGFTSNFAIKSFIPLLSSNFQANPLGVSTTSGIAALWCSKPSLKAFYSGQRNGKRRKARLIRKDMKQYKGHKCLRHIK